MMQPMRPPNDLAEALAEEVMSEMAGSFFGERRQMEERLQVLSDMVQELNDKAARVEDQARLLHQVATGPEKGRELLRMFRVDPAPFPAEIGLARRALPDRMPAAFTPRGAYVKLLEMAYEGLQAMVAAYMGAEEADAADAEGPSYALIEAVVRLLNGEIETLNRNRAPSQVLQTAKRFRDTDAARASVAGAEGEFRPGGRLDQGLAFQPVQMAGLGLRTFPLMPPLENVQPKVEWFGRKIYDQRTEMARSVLRTVRQAIRALRREERE
jgi:hypothetical protein